MDKNIKIISDKLGFKGFVFDVYQRTIEMPDGEILTKDIITHKNAAGVLVTDGNGNVIVVAQNRPATAIIGENINKQAMVVDKLTVEIPAGLAEDEEDAAKTAVRELVEETGIDAQEAKKIWVGYSDPKVSNEILEVFEAKGLKEGNQKLDEDEILKVYKVNIDEFIELVKQNKITTGLFTIIGLLQAKIDLVNKEVNNEENNEEENILAKKEALQTELDNEEKQNIVTKEEVDFDGEYRIFKLGIEEKTSKFARNVVINENPVKISVLFIDKNGNYVMKKDNENITIGQEIITLPSGELKNDENILSCIQQIADQIGYEFEQNNIETICENIYISPGFTNQMNNVYIIREAEPKDEIESNIQLFRSNEFYENVLNENIKTDLATGVAVKGYELSLAKKR